MMLAVDRSKNIRNFLSTNRLGAVDVHLSSIKVAASEMKAVKL